MRGAYGGVVAALAIAIGVSCAADAHAGTGESISSYRIAYDILADGVVHVTESFTYDFGAGERHGPERVITTTEPVDGGERIYSLTDVEAGSPSGAPDTVDLDDLDDLGTQTRIRIGDPERTVSGEQRYTLEYDIEGGLNSVDGHGELFWDAAGPDWTVPIDDLAVTVSAPGGISKQRCLFGEPGSKDPCDDGALSGGEAAFSQARVEPGEVLTIVATFSLDDVTVPEPVLVLRPTALDYFVPTPANVGAGAGLLLIGIVPLALVLRSRRDVRYAGYAPGELPPAGAPAAVERAPAEETEEVAVRAEPPPGISPGEAGMVLRREPAATDTAATLLDLAARGYLRIDSADSGDGDGDDWTLTSLRPVDNTLRPHEQALLTTLFAAAPAVRLGSDRSMIVKTVQRVDEELLRTAAERGWFRKRPVKRLPAGLGYVLAAFVFVGGFLFLIGSVQDLLNRGQGLPVVSGAMAVVLVVAALVLRLRNPRLPAGYAAYHQVAGFRRYLETVEPEQVRVEAADNTYDRYLPWAVVFDIPGRLGWLFGGLASVGFAGSVGLFAEAVETSGGGSGGLTSSSGGSGFSSSSSTGDGGGGGGGGSW